MIVRLPTTDGWLNLAQVSEVYNRRDSSGVDVTLVSGELRSYHEHDDADAIRAGLDRLADAFAGAFVAPSGGYVAPVTPTDESGEVGG